MHATVREITPEVRAAEEIAMGKLRELKNWGRWGADDERGCLNYITPEKTLAAIRSVKSGTTFELAHEIRHQGGSPKGYGRPEPRLLFQYDGADWAQGFGEGRRHTREATDDTLELPIHGTSTHVDALSHYWTDRTMYNGFPGSLVNSFGAQKLGIEKMGAVIGRGVLLDMAKHRGLEVMDPHDIITAQDLIDCAETEGVALGSGDVVLVHTGIPQVYFEDRKAGYRYPPRFYQGQPGLSLSGILYLAETEVALAGADNIAVNWGTGNLYADGRYLRPFMVGHSNDDPRKGLGDPGSLDLHAVFLRNLGLPLLELLDLSKLAAARAYEFLFIMAPLHIRGATGSPVTPLAII